MSADQKSPTQASRNSLGIRYVDKGPIGLKTVLNQIISGMDMLYPRASADISPSVSSDGTTYRLKQTPYQRANLARYPFHISDVSASGTAKVIVAYGTINNFVPTIGGTSIFTDPAPTLTVVTGTVYLDATVDGAGAVTAVAIANAASTPSDTSTHKYKTLGSVTVASGAVTAIGQSVITSLQLYLCNGTTIWEQA